MELSNQTDPDDDNSSSDEEQEVDPKLAEVPWLRRNSRRKNNKVKPEKKRRAVHYSQPVPPVLV